MKKKGFKISVQGRLGVTFNYDNEVIVSILSSGIAVIVGVNKDQEALKLYNDLVIESMGISQRRVDPEISTLLAKPSTI
jgi:hypothetical protein